MKGIIFSLFLLSIPTLFSQNNDGKEKRIAHTALEIINDVAYYKDQPYTGASFTFWDNKRINEEFHWVNGVKEGFYKEFTEEGILVTEVIYVNGLRHGAYRYFYPEGGMQSEGTFYNNQLDGEVKGYYKNGFPKYYTVYTRGIRHGKSITWFATGAIEQIATFVNDLPNGEIFAYYPDSSIRYEAVYNMGIKNGRYYQFHKSGCPAVESYYKNGVLDSVYRTWDEITCTKLEERNFLKGEKHGTFIQYGFTGDTLKIENYQYGKLSGPYILWADKQIESMGQYADNLKEGFWQFGLSTGYQHREGNYESGIMVGEWVFYDLNNKILMRQWYNDEGEVIKEKKYRKPRKK